MHRVVPHADQACLSRLLIHLVKVTRPNPRLFKGALPIAIHHVFRGAIHHIMEAPGRSCRVNHKVIQSQSKGNVNSNMTPDNSRGGSLVGSRVAEQPGDLPGQNNHVIRNVIQGQWKQRCPLGIGHSKVINCAIQR